MGAQGHRDNGYQEKQKRAISSHRTLLQVSLIRLPFQRFVHQAVMEPVEEARIHR